MTRSKSPTSSDADNREFNKLCWELIELKVAYYRPEALHTTRLHLKDVTDATYDAMELRYLELARKLGYLNTLVHKGWPGYEDMMSDPHTPMMEIDDTRPSVQLVLQKLSTPK